MKYISDFIFDLRFWCERQEWLLNHGTTERPPAPFEYYCGIVVYEKYSKRLTKFWLKKDWRKLWKERFPDYPLSPEPQKDKSKVSARALRCKFDEWKVLWMRCRFDEKQASDSSEVNAVLIYNQELRTWRIFGTMLLPQSGDEMWNWRGREHYIICELATRQMMYDWLVSEMEKCEKFLEDFPEWDEYKYNDDIPF